MERSNRGMRKTTITINGRLYDAVTGMPIKQPETPAAQPASVAKPQQAQQPMRRFSDITPKAAPVKPLTPAAHPARQHHSATHVHQKPQRSVTLNRELTKKPEPAVQATPAPAAQPAETTPTRSPHISRFATPMAPAPVAVPVTDDLPTPPEPPQATPIHPHVIKALQHRQATQAPAPHHSSKELKEMLIKEQLAQVSTQPEKPKKGFFARQPKLASVLVSSLSLLILGGYFSYINLTNISMRVAANRAGIEANFPTYRPSGYSLDGPITYAPGEVSINYRSNTNNNGFTLTQKASEWDSQAVLDNFVRKQSSNYLTIQERGITVYTFSNKAAWVNGGLLHVVEGNATLSSDQILRLATSL